MSDIFAKLYTFDGNTQLLAVKYSAEGIIRYTTMINGAPSTLDTIIEGEVLLESTFADINEESAYGVLQSMNEARLVNG